MDYIFFIIWGTIAIVIGLILSKKFRMFLFAVILFAAFIYGAFAWRNAIAEEETRTAFIVEFDLFKSTFILEDEDGYLWEFYLEENDYNVEDEYTLHLSDNANPYYE